MNKYSQEQIDEMSGFGKTHFEKWPYVKFSATTRGLAPVGTFSKLSWDDKNNLTAEPLGKTISVILLHRGRFRLKNADMTSSEVISSKQDVDIYTKEKSRLVDHGNYKEMKEKYAMGTMQYPYVILNGEEVVRLAVLPGSLSKFWEYLDSFKGEDRPLYWITNVSAGEEKRNKGGTYLEMAFARGMSAGDQQDSILDALSALDEKIKKNDAARNARDKESVAPAEVLIKADDIEITDDGNVIEEY